MLILPDTNILLRLADSGLPLTAVASTAVDQLNAEQRDLVIVPQVLYEFWAVTTRSTAAHGLGKTPEYAEQFVRAYCRLFRLLRDERTICERWLQLVTQQQISGVRSYDVRLVATMERHQVSPILTFNGSDFQKFAGVTVIDPQAVNV